MNPLTLVVEFNEPYQAFVIAGNCQGLDLRYVTHYDKL
jgi:hypothetical protein